VYTYIKSNYMSGTSLRESSHKRCNSQCNNQKKILYVSTIFDVMLLPFNSSSAATVTEQYQINKHLPITSWHCRHTYTHNHLMALCPGLPGWAGTRRNICPLTPILIIKHPLSTSSTYYDPYHPSCSIYMLNSPFLQPLSWSSLVYLLVWNLHEHDIVL